QRQRDIDPAGHLGWPIEDLGSQEPFMDAREAIAANPFFAEVMDPPDINALARRALLVDRPAGTDLIHEDGADASLFIIVDGEVEVTTGDPKHGKHIATLGPGAFFGEMSLMTG